MTLRSRKELAETVAAEVFSENTCRDWPTLMASCVRTTASCETEPLKLKAGLARTDDVDDVTTELLMHSVKLLTDPTARIDAIGEMDTYDCSIWKLLF